MSYQKANIRRDSAGRLFSNKPEYLKLREKIKSQSPNDKHLKFYSKHETNEEFIRRLVVISAAATKSDGLLRDEEKIICEEICNELDIDWEKFSKDLDDELAKIDGFDFPALEKYLLNSLDRLPTDNSMVLFEAALHIILSDGIMTENECNLLAAIGILLNIPTSKMFARIGVFLREDKDVLVDTPDNFDWLYESNQDFYY